MSYNAKKIIYFWYCKRIHIIYYIIDINFTVLFMSSLVYWWITKCFVKQIRSNMLLYSLSALSAVRQGNTGCLLLYDISWVTIGDGGIAILGAIVLWGFLQLLLKKYFWSAGLHTWSRLKGCGILCVGLVPGLWLDFVLEPISQGFSFKPSTPHEFVIWEFVLLLLKWSLCLFTFF